MIIKIFSELMTDIKPQIQESNRISSKINTQSKIKQNKNKNPTQITFKLQKLKNDNEKRGMKECQTDEYIERQRKK